MQWFDQISLPAIVVVPVIGALFLLFIPEHDLSLRKRVAVFIVVATAIFHLRNSILFFRTNVLRLDLNAFIPLGFNETLFLALDKQAFIGISFSLVLLFLLLHCSLTKNTQLLQLNSKILFLLSLTSALMLISNFGFFLLAQLVIAQTILVLNLRDGGPLRSSSSHSASVFLFLLDLAAFFAWRWQADLSILSPDFIACIYLPMITRLLVPFFSPWARLFFANSSIEVSILYLSSSFIPATIALARAHLDISFIAPIAMIAGLFGAILALGDKHLSQFLMRFIGVGGALALFLLSRPIHPEAQSKVLMYCGTLALLVCLGLLIQRAMAEDIPDKFEKGLRPLWYAVLMLLSGAPFVGVGAFIWQIFPADSLPWLTTFALLTWATYSRVQVLSLDKGSGNLVLPSLYTRSSIFNLWSCIGLVVLMTLSLQMVFS